ncbi:MAG: hypothetical protein JXB04_12665 [Kiritimatiellae bacterium]|nr:hypothetical protein [Kiritimatiellia bacterium]
MQMTSFTFEAVADGKPYRKKIPWKTGCHTLGPLVLRTRLVRNQRVSVNGTHSLLQLDLRRKDGKAFELQRLVYDCAVNLTNFGRVLIPDSGRFYMDKWLPRQVWDNKFTVTGVAMRNPFFALMDPFERPRFSFGLVGQVHETEFSFYSPGRNEKNSLTVHGGISGGRLRWKCTQPVIEDAPWNQGVAQDLSFGRVRRWREALFQSTGERSWFHALRKYGAVFRAWDGHGYPHEYYVDPNAFRPALCTWRIINSDDMSHDWLVRQAKLCKDVGLEALIIDDGWYAVGMDGEGVHSWMGDWPRAIEKDFAEFQKARRNPRARVRYKFADISRTVGAIRKQGIAPVLWYCPIGLSPDARSFEKNRRLLVKIQDKDEYFLCGGHFHTLCCRNPEARALMAENLKRVIRYGAAGIKNDLFDYMPGLPCTSTEHTHDVPTTTDGVRLAYLAMWRAVLETNRHCIYSVKNNDGNVDLAPLAHNVRGGDSPFDENINTMRSIYPSAFAPVVHNDYLAFTNWEKPEHVAVLMIKQVCTGVPNFSLDLEKLSEKHKRVMRAWMRLFRHIRDLYGTFNFEPQDPAMTVFQRWNDAKAHITLLSAGAREILWFDRPTVFISNATEHADVYVKGAPKGVFTIRYYDHLLRLQKKVDVDIAATGRIPTVAGGLIIVTRKGARPSWAPEYDNGRRPA